ncbi:cysteine-rich with EGF-like domain protein 1 [Striga asiatica]|uniref:Cysteine-rich with EGF-like domain protein 1 n=1 Tax=Striga asiatica TaxID=4170 RepID=A0A5A7QF35_STRAF|nr:cysteine-rich with EGF-like domain protein 1 [Striga asiatica]
MSSEVEPSSAETSGRRPGNRILQSRFISFEQMCGNETFSFEASVLCFHALWGPKLRLYGEGSVGCVQVRRAQLKGKGAQEVGHKCLPLHECKVLADASPWAPAEGHESRLPVGCLEAPLCKPVWTEFEGILTPYLRVPVEHCYGQLQKHALWDSEASQLSFLLLPSQGVVLAEYPENLLPRAVLPVLVNGKCDHGPD